MHSNESAENYLEAILVLSQTLPVVRSVDVAEKLSFRKSSVSVAMKNLRENAYIEINSEGHRSLCRRKAISNLQPPVGRLRK